MKLYSLVILTFLCISFSAKAMVPPLPSDIFMIFYDNSDDVPLKLEVAEKLCTNSNKQSPATQVMCIFAQGKENSKATLKLQSGFLIKYNTTKELISTLNASQQACFYGPKKNIITNIMCDYYKSAKRHLDNLKAHHCIDQTFISNTTELINTYPAL